MTEIVKSPKPSEMAWRTMYAGIHLAPTLEETLYIETWTIERLLEDLLKKHMDPGVDYEASEETIGHYDTRLEMSAKDGSSVAAVRSYFHPYKRVGLGSMNFGATDLDFHLSGGHRFGGVHPKILHTAEDVKAWLAEPEFRELEEGHTPTVDELRIVRQYIEGICANQSQYNYDGFAPPLFKSDVILE